jgi:hypothetical protein
MLSVGSDGVSIRADPPNYIFLAVVCLEVFQLTTSSDASP